MGRNGTGRNEHLDILLLSMPFGPLRQPSLGLSLLQASLPERRVEVRYLNLRYADRIGWDLYQDIFGRRLCNESLVGEWVFSAALRGSLEEDNFLEKVAVPAASAPLTTAELDELRRLRRDADAFLEECLVEVEEHRPRIVGFTTVFQQQLASLALARKIKEAFPETLILFGGANCEGVMGLEVARSFPFIDAAVSGEADQLFPILAQRLLAGEAVDDLPGVFTQTNLDTQNESRPGDAPRILELDSVPRPDFRDFFTQWEAADRPADVAPRLLFETSRGCWWGAKQHCTFCGLNGTSMTFRSKSAERALDELTELCQRYPDTAVMVVDNILDMAYFRDFIPALAESDLGVQLFYEVKANLKKSQIRQLWEAGIREIQPGIESFSAKVLTLMRKGVSPLQNVQLLKWCREIGVWPTWNLIWGFPGEPAEDYPAMADLFPLLHHLPPPTVACPILLHRFSPNYEQAEAMGFADVRPLPAYDYLYDLPRERVANLAYYFDYGYQDERDVEAYTRPLAAAVRDWQGAFQKSDLVYTERGDGLQIWDLRQAAHRPLTVLDGVERALLEACDGIRSLGWLRQNAADGPLSEQQAEDRLGPLVEGGLMLRDGDRFLALPIPSGAISAAALAEASGIVYERPAEAGTATGLHE